MARTVDDKTKLVIQGITGYQGTSHSQAMRDFGTQVVAGVRPGKAGEKVNDIPVFDSVRDAVNRTGANTSCVFVPAPGCRDAALEAIYAGIEPGVIVTEH